MKITKDNLNEVLFENHDARLLIADVVTIPALTSIIIMI